MNETPYQALTVSCSDCFAIIGQVCSDKCDCRLCTFLSVGKKLLNKVMSGLD